MFCPHCDDDVQRVRCSACQRAFDTHKVERMGQLAVLQDAVEVWTVRGLLDRAAADAMLTETHAELSILRARLPTTPTPVASSSAARPSSLAKPSPTTTLAPPSVVPAVSAEPARREPSRPQQSTAAGSVHSRSGGAGVPSVPAQDPERASSAVSATGPQISPTLPRANDFSRTLPAAGPRASSGAGNIAGGNDGAMAAAPPSSVVASPASVRATSKRGRRDALPGQRRLTWRQVGLSLLSDRALNTLLLVGALLILASATVISTLNPTHLSPLIHLAMMLATTAAFFASGHALRARFGLVRSGGALLTIGAALLPLDIWTLGRGGVLRLSTADTVLAASALCLAAYLLIHLLSRGRDRLCALLTAVAGACAALALANRAALPPEWWDAALLSLATVYALAAPRLRARLPVLSHMLLRAAHALALGALTVLTLVSAAALAGVTLNASAGATLTSSWWLGTLFYLVYGRVGGERHYLTVAASLSAVAALVTLQLLPVLGPWISVAIAGLACVYMTIGYRRSRRMAAASGAGLRDLLGHWPYQIAVALSAVALLWPIAEPHGRTVAAGVLALLYALGAGRAPGARGPVWAAVAVALLPLILFHLSQALPLPDPLPAWAALALGAAGAGEALARRDGSGQAQARQPWSWPLPWKGGTDARSPFARPLLALGYGTAAAVLCDGLTRCLTSWTTSGLPIPLAGDGGSVVAALSALTAGAVGAALLRRDARPLYPTAAFAVAPYLSLAVALGQRLGWGDAHAMQSWALMSLALLYLAAAAWLDGGSGHGQTGRAVAGARVLYPMGYALSALATLLVAGDVATLPWLFGLLLASWAWSAYWVATGRHRLFLRTIAALFPGRGGPPAEVALFGYLCAWLFPVWLLSRYTLWLPDDDYHSGFGLALTMLAALYLAGSRYLAQRAPMQAWPWLSAGAVLIALGPLLAVSAPTPRLLSTVLALAACAAMARLTRRPEWVIEVALALPLLAYVILHAMRLANVYEPLGFLPSLMLCLAAGDRLRGAGLRPTWSWPFHVVGYSGLYVIAIVLILTADIDNSFLMDNSFLGLGVVTALAFAACATIHAWNGRRGRLRTTRHSAWLSVAYGFIALEGLLKLGGVPGAVTLVCWAAVGLAITVALPLLPTLWLRPLGWPATALACLCPLWAACLTEQPPAGFGPQVFVITLAIAGLQVVTMGYQRRARRLVYGGIAVVLGAYLGQLGLAAVTQPQLFVLPVGVYLLGVAWAERRIAPRRAAGKLLEVTGLLLLLGTSLLQALGYAANGVPASGYDLVALAEGLVLLWVGDTLRWKDTLTAGALALGADALLIVAQPLRAIDTWYAMAIAGLAIIGFVIAVEKKRQGLATLFGQWRRVRETWD